MSVVTYGFANPLVDSMSATIAAVQAHLDREEGEQTPPHMPEQSGVEAPRTRPLHRLTDSYYKLEHDEWLPQIIDDPKLPGLILEGGQHLPLKYTRQRDEVVTWLLFDTGARVSEVTCLMLGDWATLGTHTKARAFNKGSYGRRTKTLSFYDDTVILLKRYFDEEWIRFDPNGYRLEDYLLLSKRTHVDLQTIPLFLTAQGTQLTPYEQHRSWRGSPRKRAKPLAVASPASLGVVKPSRDEQRVRQRYLRMSKEALVERLITTERTLAEQRERWLDQQDDVLTWRMRAEAAETQLQTLKEKSTKQQT